MTMAAMPWKETDVMKERVKLILEWEGLWDEYEGYVNVSELCRKYGITRETGCTTERSMVLRP